MSSSSSTSSGGRSSTASHYARNYETVSAGFAEHDFYRVLLDNNLWDESPTQLAGLAVLLSVLLFWMPTTTSRSGNGRSPIRVVVVYWTIACIACLTALPHVTLTPLLTTVVYTRTTYPYAVVVPHCIVANAAYRTRCGDDDSSSSCSRVRALVVSFFLYGFGGSLVSDVLMGLPVTALGHDRIIPCHVLGWALIWFCPYDWLYRAYHHHHADAAENGGNPFIRTVLTAAEAVDAVTTPMGRMARAARELKNKTTAPLVAGLTVGTGGAVLRHLLLADAAGTTATTTTSSWDTIETGLYRTLGYCLIFGSLAVWPCVPHDGQYGWTTTMSDPEIHHCDSYGGSDLLRVVIVTTHVAWTLLVDAGVVTDQQHPAVWSAHRIRRHGATVAHALRLGPPPPPPDVADVKHADGKKKD